jgi:ABC-2 type transport system ATP-binding protein
MIAAVDLSKRYPDGRLALDALNLRVEAGEIYCLLGAPGAGKTTAVNLFLGLTPPTAGRALIDGADVVREPLAARRRLAWVGADLGFYDRLTARQNLEFFDRLAGRPEGRRGREEHDRALREVGLPEATFGRRVRDFSPGMVRKLGLAAAILKQAPALLLDEPLAGLDPRSTAEMAELLDAQRRQGKALLLATHDLFWAGQLADRICVLQEGRQVLVRSRGELRTEDLERLYLGERPGAESPLREGPPARPR